MATAFVKPAPGRRVLNHQQQFLEITADGTTVTLDRDFRRRIDDGDLVVVNDPAPPPAPAKPKSKE